MFNSLDSRRRGATAFLRALKGIYIGYRGDQGGGQQLQVRGGTRLDGALTYGGVTLTNNVTGTGKMVLDAKPSFPTTIGVGGAAASASGSGISFPASDSPSSDANTLDDYEEGTWTPTDATGQGITFSGSDCAYTKIGRKVFIDAYVNTSASGSGTANGMAGLPFASANVNAMLYRGSMPGVMNIYANPVTVTVGKNTTVFTVRDRASENSITWAQMSGCELAFQLNYNV